MFWIFRKKTPIEKLRIRDREIREGLERSLHFHIPDDIDMNALHQRFHEMLIEYASSDDFDSETYIPHEYDNHSCNVANARWELDVFCTQANETGSVE